MRHAYLRQSVVCQRLTRKGLLQRRCSPPKLWELPWPLYSGYYPSCSRSSSSLGSPEPGEKCSKEVEEEKKTLRGIAELINGLRFQSPAALQELFDRSCRYYLKHGSARSPSNELNASQRLSKSFRKEARDIIQKRTDPGDFQDKLLSNLDDCYEDFETLQAKLDDAVHANYRLDDEEDVEGDPEPQMQRETKDLQGSEAHPLHERWVMDVQVHDVQFSVDMLDTDSIPSSEKSILLSNLPEPCEEESIRASLAPCGEISRVEFCNEWNEMETSYRDTGTGEMEENLCHAFKDRKVRKAPPKYTSSYAIVEFSEPRGRQQALRKLSRVHGILFNEIQMVKLLKKTKPATVGRPSFPQDIRFKRSLLLRSLPVEMDPAKVLHEIRQRFDGMGRLTLLNARAFGVKGRGPFRQLEVGPDGVYDQYLDQVEHSQQAISAFPCPRNDGGNGGALVLRFSCFKDAYIARVCLQGMELEGQKVFCGFPPWRPHVIWADSRGEDLPEVKLMDFAVPRASAKYMWGCDPAHDSAFSCEEVEEMARCVEGVAFKGTLD